MMNYKDEQQQAEAFQELAEKTVNKTGSFLKKAFQDMKESAKAKADAKKSWDDAHMSPAERAAKK